MKSKNILVSSISLHRQSIRSHYRLEAIYDYPTVNPVIGNSEPILLLRTNVVKEYSVKLICSLSALNGKSRD